MLPFSNALSMDIVTEESTNAIILSNIHIRSAPSQMADSDSRPSFCQTNRCNVFSSPRSQCSYSLPSFVSSSTARLDFDTRISVGLNPYLVLLSLYYLQFKWS
jgi:hypothetical protein